MRYDEYNAKFPVISINNDISRRGECYIYFKQICDNNDSKVIISLIKFLSYSDIINLNLTCKSLNKKINEKIKKKYIRLAGIHESFRSEFWMANIKYQK